MTCLFAAFSLTAITFSVCVDLRERIAPSGIFIVFEEEGNMTCETPPAPAREQQRAADVVETVQYVLTIFYFTLAIIVSGTVIYRGKLKRPILKLQDGARRIMDQDVDFSIDSEGTDELGQLCIAFEQMRSQLKSNNQELWRQTEERKRLNAAFSHDLRNPVTILKGSVRVMEKGLERDCISKEEILDGLRQLESQANRIELYVEAMSSAQKLEETVCIPGEVAFGALRREFQENTTLLLMEKGIEVDFRFLGSDHTVLWLDRGIFYNISDNLMANAGRYARKGIEVTLSVNQRYLSMMIQDDGPGFSDKILQKGMEPFVRDGENTRKHFGMGLYICRLLAEKHGGEVCLENTDRGALAKVKLQISKP